MPGDVGPRGAPRGGEAGGPGAWPGASGATWPGASGAGRRDDGFGIIGLGEIADRIRFQPATPKVRLALALAGWPPIGLGVAIAIGELTGCARFAAACSSASGFSTSVAVAQLAILAVLLVIPPLARLAAFGSLAIVLATLPIVAFLTAAGATYDPEPGTTALLVLLSVAWLIGVGVGLPRRSRRMAR